MPNNVPSSPRKTILRSELRELKEATKSKLNNEAAAQAAKADVQMSPEQPVQRVAVHREDAKTVYMDTRPPLMTPTFTGGGSSGSKPNRRRRR
ncbi:MAG: hypothetical protein AAB692_04175 [Patescibacteria group bacterium]